MVWAGWTVALFLGLLALYLGLRKSGPASNTVSTSSFSATRNDAPATRADAPVTRPGEDPGAQSVDADDAMREMARYLRRAVAAPLEASLDTSDPGPAVRDAIDALQDLIAYAGSAGAPADRSENLFSILQAVTREYTSETRVPVRVRGPDRPVRVRVATERFKDAVYLVLVNAGRFGRGETIDVEVAEADAERAEVRIRDKGPGFTSEALLRAFQPFWTSEDDALGLGLPHAKRLIEAQDGSVSIRNAEDGGAETVITIRRG